VDDVELAFTGAGLTPRHHVLDVAPEYQGAKPNAALADGNVAEPGNPAQIDQHARRRQPEG
jgi:hypothetical protein